MAELYDMKTDPGETKNLIAFPQFEAKVRELEVQLAVLMDETGIKQDKMPIDEGIKKDLPDQKIR